MKADESGKLNGPGAKPAMSEQMELSRLRAENKRLQMELEIAKKRRAMRSSANCATYSMRCSMSRKGNCWDVNAPTESFFNSLKNERVHATHYQTHQDAKTDLFEYIEVFL